jgi:hypothetical protein
MLDDASAPSESSGETCCTSAENQRGCLTVETNDGRPRLGVSPLDSSERLVGGDPKSYPKG